MKRTEQRLDNHNAYLLISRSANAAQYKPDEHYPVQNLSKGGVRFSSENHFDLEERVDLSLYIDEKLSHKATGRICYHDEDNNHNNFYGVSFLDKYPKL